MRRFLQQAMLAVIGSTLFWSAGGAERPAFKTYEFTYRVNVQHIPKAAKRLELWIPAPQDDDRQSVSQMKVLSPYQYKQITDPLYGNRAYYLDVTPSLPDSLPVSLTFRVRRNESGPLRATLAETDALRKRYLQPDSLVPIDGAIAREADTVAGHLQGNRTRARALYDHVVATMKYDKSATGWGRGDAIFACNERRGNCTDIHSLLIGMARSLGIPSRFTMGFPVPDTLKTGGINGYHCWVDLYLDGEGWIPVDASEAIKHPEKADYFFGALGPDRVAFTTGRDIRLNGDADSTTVNYFISPFVLVDGQPYKDVVLKCEFREL